MIFTDWDGKKYLVKVKSYNIFKTISAADTKYHYLCSVSSHVTLNSMSVHCSNFDLLTFCGRHRWTQKYFIFSSVRTWYCCNLTCFACKLQVTSFLILIRFSCLNLDLSVGEFLCFAGPICTDS